MNEVTIPITQFEPDTLRALVEEYITREGTKYKEKDISLDDKIVENSGLVKR